MASSGRSSSAAQTITTGTPIRSPYRFNYVKSGGFAGIRNELLVDSAAKRLTLRRPNQPAQTAPASDADLQELKEKLEAADFLHLTRSFRCQGCADQFIFNGTLTTGGRSHSVHWEEGSDAPPALFAISTLADRLIEDNFGA